MEATIPVYISLTSIECNQDILLQTLESIVTQSMLPDKVYLFLSSESFMLDRGFKNGIISNVELREFLDEHSDLIEIQWVPNIGSYRKLLPLLKQKWDEDCLIITIDDDTVYMPNLVFNLVADYQKHECVISYRGWTPLFNTLGTWRYRSHRKKYSKPIDLYNFATGKGGILYHPKFFHATKDLIFNRKIYGKTCASGDDIWFYLVRIKNDIPCYVGKRRYQLKDLTKKNKGLCHEKNGGDKNTKMFLYTAAKLQLISEAELAKGTKNNLEREKKERQKKLKTLRYRSTRKPRKNRKVK